MAGLFISSRPLSSSLLDSSLSPSPMADVGRRMPMLAVDASGCATSLRADFASIDCGWLSQDFGACLPRFPVPRLVHWQRAGIGPIGAVQGRHAHSNSCRALQKHISINRPRMPRMHGCHFGNRFGVCSFRAGWAWHTQPRQESPRGSPPA